MSEVDAVESLDDLGAEDGIGGRVRRFAMERARCGNADQGEQREDRLLGILLGYDLLGPQFRILELECDAGGILHEAVGVVQFLEGRVDGGGVLLRVKGFECEPRFASVLVRAVASTLHRRHCFTRVRDAVQAALGLAAADGEVHRAVRRVDHHVR